MLYHALVGKNIGINKKIVFIGEKSYTYAELDHMAVNFACFMNEKGIGKGDKIIVIMECRIETIGIILGCILSGIIFIPIAPGTEKTHIEMIIEETKADCILDGDFKLKTGSGIRSQREVRQTPEDRVYILYTSGSTGCSKGVIGCVRQILFCVKGINARLKNNKKDKILNCLPLAFDYGLYQIFLALDSRAELYLENGSNLQKIPAILYKKQITALPLVPSMLHTLVYTGCFVRIRFDELRYICTTGDRLNLEMVEQLHRCLPHAEVIPMYGLTECKRVAIMPWGNYEKTKKGSCGLPLEGIEVRLVNKDKKGVGELIVIGDNVMEGYYADYTDTVFFTDPITGKRALRTGDLFYLDKEGFLYFNGRIKRIIKSRGYRISNIEIEDYFLKLKEVMEVRVEGLSDKLAGERIGLAVYVNNDDAFIHIKEVICKMPMICRPYMIYISEIPLPKNRNGKYDDTEICRLIVQNGKRWTGKD